ncbi:MAG: DUF1565 domain-containing protein [Clostridia bacterium]|nr:DUF1565 domain-containing protein [Clostridia bacterium]
MKKQLAVILSVLLLLPMAQGALAEGVYYTPETAGPMYFKVDLQKPLSREGGEEKLVLGAGGSAAFDIFFGADTESVELSYEAAEGGEVKILTEQNAYGLNIVQGEGTATVAIAEHKGSHTVTVMSDANITITEIAFHKAKIDGISPFAQIAVGYTDYEAALQTAVVVNPSKNAIKVNGAFRYYDYTDTSLAPKNIDGKVYIPIHAFARAFSLYYEDYGDLNYAYISRDNTDVFRRGDDAYMIKNGVKTDINKFAVYEDGITWVPFRQTAELFGETVVWRDGYAIADDRIRANDIVSNDIIFAELQKDFEKFDISGLNPKNTYYVSQAVGSDSNDGSEGAPFKTIQRAADVAQAGDTVIIREGVYRETVTPKNSGNATQPVIFKAADGENVTISAFEELSGFKPYKNGIYQAPINSIGYDRNFVILNDEILREGRHPNTDTSEVAAPHPNYTDENVMRATYGAIAMPVEQKETGEYNYAVSDKDLNQDEPDFWKGGTFVTMTGEGWTLCYAQITGSKKGRIDLTHNGLGGYAIDTYYLDKKPNDWGYITHHLNTVDMPGEWYVDNDNNILYIIPPEGTKGEDLRVEVKQRQVVIDLTDKKFVQFHNINTRGGGITMAGDTEMDVIDGGTHKYICQIDWSAAHATHDLRYIDRANRWTNKADGPEMGEAGFFAHGKNNAFVNTHIAYSAAAGIYMTGLYGYIENNFIESASYMGTYPGAITLEGVKWDEPTAKYGGHTVVANTLVGSGRANLYLSRNQAAKGSDMMLPYIGCDLSFNRIRMGATVSRDTGSFYSFGLTAGNDLVHTRLHHNVVYDIGTSTENSSINTLLYHDGYANFYDTYSNVLFETVKGYVYNDVFSYLGVSDYKNYVEKWGNVSAGLVPRGMEGLTVKDYPFGKMFDVGSTVDGHSRIMANYERANEKYIFLAEGAELQNGAKIGDDGAIDMPSPYSSITFKDVSLSDSGTELSICYVADRLLADLKNPPEITVEFIKDGNVTETRYVNAFSCGKELSDVDRTMLYLKPETAGTYDVRIRVNKSFVRPIKLLSAPC